MTSHEIDPRSGTSAGRELAQQCTTTMARTADLVRKLSALADRYEADDGDGGARAAERRASVALMRTTAEAGRQLIRALASPALPQREQPAPSSLERADLARSREVAAGSATHALDSHASAYALVARLQARAVVRQAQGVLMDRAGMTAGEAFEALLLAASGPMTIESVADYVIRRAELPGADDVP